VLAVKCEGDNIEDVLHYLGQLAGDTKDTAVLTSDNTIAYIHNIETENDYQSAVDFAQMLCDNIEQELSLKVKIGVGSYAKDAFELASAFSQGSSAIKMGMASNGKSNIYSYKEFIMMRMIEEIPQAALKKYLDILLDSGAKEILGDPEMLSTAEEFLANNLNISETSRNLYLHRNTLMYRLDKIEKITGLNIRRFSDAVTFRIILILYKHLKH
jgi:carbohydrate diacid regulator